MMITSRHIKLIKEHYYIKNKNITVTMIIIYEISQKFYRIQYLETSLLCSKFSSLSSLFMKTCLNLDHFSSSKYVAKLG